MPMRESNEVEYDGDDVLFYSEYDPDFIIAPKNKVPVSKRNWDPENFCFSPELPRCDGLRRGREDLNAT